MNNSGYLSTLRRWAVRWSRRLAVVAVVGGTGVAAAPLPSFAPAASFAVEDQSTRAAVPHAERSGTLLRASSTPAAAEPSVAEGIPAPALSAYRFAAGVLARTDPACGLDWSLLAAIGHVESDHGRYGGAVLDQAGTSTPRILGPRLDGAGDVAAIADTDDGALDGDRRWDRAVGPMQFIPSTWAMVGADADGDGTRDPFDIDDAALSAAAYLCAGDDDLSTVAGQRAAVRRYNPSRAYVDLVLALAADYARQHVALTLPTPAQRGPAVSVPALSAVLEHPAHPAAPPRVRAPAPGRTADPHAATATRTHENRRASAPRRSAGASHDGSAATVRTSRTSRDRTQRAARQDPGPRGAGGSRTGGGATTASEPGSGGSTTSGDQGPAAGGGTGGTGATDGGGTAGDGSGSGDTSGGTSGGTQEPSPTSLSGTLQRADDGTWSVGGSTVDFGDDAYLGNEALHDFDGVDGVESNLNELETLVGQQVTVDVDADSRAVLRVNDQAYR